MRLTKSSKSPQIPWNHRIESILHKRGLLELWTGVIGADHLKKQVAMSTRNQEAENRSVRQKLWGNNGDTEDDDMGHTILGDVSFVPPAASKGLGPLATMALGALIPGGPIIGYLVNEALQQPVPPVAGDPFIDTDSTLKLGLGRLEDYIAE